jgi:hypothetical protein
LRQLYIGTDEGLHLSLYNVEVVRRLVEGGAYLTRQDTVGHKTALMWADHKGLSTITACLRGKDKEKELGIVGASISTNAKESHPIAKE